ncbi:MAG: helix-turn-helix transcriptional regulator, partial [Raoultibacter sp.]
MPQYTAIGYDKTTLKGSTMNFADNLIFLRQSHGITQETLAEQLGVSRQTISKWEAGANYPEMDKLLQICDLYHTNLDDLMRGGVQIANKNDTQRYDKHMNRFCAAIIAGVSLVLLGTGVLCALEALGFPENIATMIFLTFVLVAVIIFITSGLNHQEFKRQNPRIEPHYETETLNRFGRRFSILIATGVGLILFDVLILCGIVPESGNQITLGGAAYPDSLLMVFFLPLIALAVGILIYAGMQKSKYDLSELTYLVHSKTASGSGISRKHLTPEQLRTERIIGALCGAIMIIATIVFFALGFSGGHTLDGNSMRDWRDTGFSSSWIAFVIGGLICGVVVLIGNAFTQSKEEMVAQAQQEDAWIQFAPEE